MEGKVDRVLIVEDDKDIQSAMRQLLELEGHEVAVADNGQEALEFLRDCDERCLILLDLMMPVMNGWELGMELLKEPSLSRHPVLVMSADAQVAQKASQIAARGHLRKPIDLYALLDIVGQYTA